MGKKIFAICLALFMLLQIPAVVDALDDFGVQTTAEAATYKLKEPVISKLTNVSGGVKVQWGKVSGAANYRVMYKTSSSGSWKTAGTTTSTSYTFKNVSSGKTYYFTVRCVSKSGKTATSAYDKTGEKIKYIAKPVIKSLSNTSTGVKITWGKVAGAAKYRVLMKTSSGWKTVADTTSTNYTYKTTNSGKKYTFSVRCVSATGKSTTSAYDTTGKSIQFIEKPKLKTLTSTENGVKLTWTPCEGATRYRVLLKTDSGWKKVKDTTKSGYTYTDVTTYGEYTLTVRCIDDDGNYISYYDTKGMTVKYAYPQVYSQLKDEYIVNEGASQNLYFYISDWEATYRWYFKDADEDEFHRSTAFTGTSYSVDMSDDVNGRQVYCVATDSNGIKVKSVVATLWQTSPFRFNKLDDNTVAITGYYFDGKQQSLTVPSRIYGRKVSTIWHYAFNYNDYLTGITLPKTVTTIGNGAFASISCLTKVTLPDSLRTIGSSAFGCCENLTAIKLPSGLTSIESGAFASTPLTTITIPASVTSIGDKAFYNCDSLTEVKFASGSRLTDLGNNTFFDSSLTTIKLPASLKSIGNDVFAQCRSLSSVTLPASLKSIGVNAFRLCEGLTSIKLPSKLTTISDGAFSHCGLTSIDIPDSVTSVGTGVFEGCDSMTSASLSAGMTEIPDSMFSVCNKLSEVDIPDSITSFGDAAFFSCDLRKIDYPSSLKHIGEMVFPYNHHLTGGDFPEGLLTIGDSAFSGIYLGTVYLPDSLTFIGEYGLDGGEYICSAGTYAHQWCIENKHSFTLR